MLIKGKIFALVGTMLALGGCFEDKGAEPAAVQIPNVEVEVVEPQDIPLSFEFSARAQGSKETEVRARVGGILLKRNYVEGAQVEEGQVLFEIDPAPFKVALSQSKAKLEQTQAQLKAAESQWKRIESLFKDRVVSEKNRDEARANLDSLKASAALAQAEVDAAQLNLDYTTVKAPISGITSLETQSEGSLIAVNGLLTSITQLDPIYVIFSASESDIASLTNMADRGLLRNPQNRSEITAKLRTGNDQLYPLEGKINFMNPNVDESTGTIKLRAVFPNPERRLRPGQFLRLIMEGLTRIDALVVPQEAIMQGAAGPFVYVVNAENMVTAVNVRTGVMDQHGGWIIDEGLKPGDKVIVSGLMKIRPGMKVNPVTKQ